MQLRTGQYVQTLRCELHSGWFAEHLCPLQLSHKQMSQCLVKLSVHGHPGSPLQIPAYTAELGSAGGGCALGCLFLRNQQELRGFPPVPTSPLPAFSALSWMAAPNTSTAAGSRCCKAWESLGSGAGPRASSGGQQGGCEECDWARLNPQAGERGRAPGDTFFSFGDVGSVSCVSEAAAQGTCLLLPTVCWHLHQSPTCWEKQKGHVGAPDPAGDWLAVPPEEPPATLSCFPEAADSDGSSQPSFASERCESQP